MSADPFLIAGPAVVSFSGGPTSGYMLKRILEAHGGALPDDVLVCFANTGEETDATLDFIARCGSAWAVPIVWLEYRHGYKPGAKRRHRWAEVVSHDSACRKGEPFDALLGSKRIVPDRTRRFCTEQLKVLTIHRYLVGEIGWSSWANVVGFRADESVRIEERTEREAARPGRHRSVFPLAAAGVQEMDVLAFWRTHPFRLDRGVDGDGGNCGGMCFMMPSDRIGRVSRRDPERAARWIAREARYGSKTMAPGRSYASVREVALAQGVLPWDDAGPCNMGCGA
jgi:3'-phosphoadenosine 5'-phosphosulfate sulfotransferase (PAPS reductase)/FAD synthetase